MSITAEEARAAIEANLPSRTKYTPKAMKRKQKVKAARDHRYILTAGGLVDIDASCRALGLTRTELVNRRWDGGSAEHRVKCAVIKEDAEKLKRALGSWPKPLVRTASGAIDIEESLLSLGLSRDTVIRKRWKQGSNPHRLKSAIRCGWKEALKAKNAHAYRDSNGKRSRDMGPTYSTNGNIMGKAGMKEKGLEDLSQVV